MTGLELREARSRADVEAFIAAARAGQARNSRWIELPAEETRRALDPKRSPVLRENEVGAFVALRDGVPVGRIAAVVNRAHLAKYHDACGHFGLIEAVDDAEVFAALLGAAGDFLRARGMRLMRGPFSLTINHEAGLLVEGFDEPHVVRTNHAPPHYAARLEALGLVKAMDLYAYVCDVGTTDFPERVARLAARAGVRGVVTEGLTLTGFARGFRRVLDLYNDAWADNWGSIPVSDAEAKMIAALTLPVARPTWIRLARAGGEDVAVLAQIPDVNEALRGLHGRLWPFGWIRALAGTHLGATRLTRVPMIGVARKWRGTRTGALAVSLLLAEALDAARRAGVEGVEISWMLETNRAVLNLVESLPARRARVFRVYQSAL
ncbi:hypothetical protein [Methylocella sp.]|uniref:hypothetical protein n=1 Tax=Methylocella sp. TaxID=1978226 RepID=UPI003783BFA4